MAAIDSTVLIPGETGPGKELIARAIHKRWATNRDLAADVDEGDFRRDLYYRLNVFPVNVPPLRERVEDIRLRAEYPVKRYGQKASKKITAIDRSTFEILQNYDWPENVRELQNIIERAVILCDTPVL